MPGTVGAGSNSNGILCGEEGRTLEWVFCRQTAEIRDDKKFYVPLGMPLCSPWMDVLWDRDSNSPDSISTVDQIALRLSVSRRALSVARHLLTQSAPGLRPVVGDKAASRTTLPATL